MTFHQRDATIPVKDISGDRKIMRNEFNTSILHFNKITSVVTFKTFVASSLSQNINIQSYCIWNVYILFELVQLLSTILSTILLTSVYKC